MNQDSLDTCSILALQVATFLSTGLKLNTCMSLSWALTDCLSSNKEKKKGSNNIKNLN